MRRYPTSNRYSGKQLRKIHHGNFWSLQTQPHMYACAHTHRKRGGLGKLGKGEKEQRVPVKLRAKKPMNLNLKFRFVGRPKDLILLTFIACLNCARNYVKH